MRRISTVERRSRLAVQHRLTPERRSDDVAQITDDLVALHSSDPATVFLSAGLRMQSPSIAAIERALYVDRSIVRHHAFRRTLWAMTPTVARLAHASATAKIAVAERRKILSIVDAEPDIDVAEDWWANALGSVQTLLAAEGPLPTREIGKRLPALTRPLTIGRGTRNPAEVAAHTRLVLLAGFEADLVRTAPTHGWNTAEYAWADTAEWLGQPLTGVPVDQAAAGLLERWLDRFGPATETDIRWWTGWTVTQMRAALDTIDAQPVLIEGDQPAWILGDEPDEGDGGPWLALLPGLDPTTMGWKERGWYLSEAAARRTFDRWGNAGPTVWRNGEVVGGWVQREDGSVAVELFVDLTRSERTKLDEQIDRFVSLVGDTRIRVRFPAPNQKDLLDS